jgi:hypothetical protein
VEHKIPCADDLIELPKEDPQTKLILLKSKKQRVRQEQIQINILLSEQRLLKGRLAAMDQKIFCA